VKGLNVKVITKVRDHSKSVLPKLLRQYQRDLQYIKENPRTIFQCIARGCEGCSVCKVKNAPNL
jgi:hypothetical protein